MSKIASNIERIDNRTDFDAGTIIETLNHLYSEPKHKTPVVHTNRKQKKKGQKYIGRASFMGRQVLEEDSEDIDFHRESARVEERGDWRNNVMDIKAGDNDSVFDGVGVTMRS